MKQGLHRISKIRRRQNVNGSPSDREINLDSPTLDGACCVEYAGNVGPGAVSCAGADAGTDDGVAYCTDVSVSDDSRRLEGTRNAIESYPRGERQVLSLTLTIGASRVEDPEAEGSHL